MFVQSEKFKKIFPKACRQMEENLARFIEANKITTNTSIATNESSELSSGGSGGGGGGGGGEQPLPRAVTAGPPKLMRRLSMNSTTTHVSLDPAGRFIQNQVTYKTIK